MNTSDTTNTCANCGNEGRDVTNTCNKCKSVMYCNAACKKKHRHKHKKDCEEHLRLAAERAAELHDEALFKQPPPQEKDCPICFLPLSLDTRESTFKSCCGKLVCLGCVHAMIEERGEEEESEGETTEGCEWEGECGCKGQQGGDD